MRLLNTTEVPVHVAKATVVSEAVATVATGVRMPGDFDRPTTPVKGEATEESIVEELCGFHRGPRPRTS